MDRRTFLGTMIGGVFPFFIPGLAQAAEPLGSPELSNGLEQRLRELIGDKYAAVSLLHLNPDGDLLGEVNINSEYLMPVANSFQTMVLLWYLSVIPENTWQVDMYSDVYTMMSKGDLTATQEVLKTVANFVRQSDPGNLKNDIENFNDFLTSFGVDGVLGRLDVSNTGSRDRRDDRYIRNLQLNGQSYTIVNTVNLETLQRFYTHILAIEKAGIINISSTFKYLASIIDPLSLSPLERAFLGTAQFIGKNGFLPVSVLPIGPSHVDSGIVILPNGDQIVVSIAALGENTELVEQLASEIGLYVNNVSPSAGGESKVTLRKEQKSHFPYFFTGDEKIDTEGPLEISAESRDFLNRLVAELGIGVGGVITVNLYDGSVRIWDLDSATLIEEFRALVGGRLPFGSSLATIQRDTSSLYPDYSYDPIAGILTENRNGHNIPQHTLSVPMICVAQGTNRSTQFAGVSTIDPVNYLVLDQIRTNAEGALEYASIHPDQTIHTVPHLDESDPASQDYRHREEMLAAINALGVRIDGIDINWSRACTNVLQEYFSRMSEFIARKGAENKKVAVVFSTPGIDDWSHLCAEAGHEPNMHPTIGNNLQQFLSSSS